MENSSNEGRRPGRPTRKEAAAIAELVLVGARDVFCEQGFAGAGMDDIAAAVGVSKLTIYRRYGSKEALLIASVDHHLAKLTAKVGPADPRAQSPLEALRQAARTLFEDAILPENVRFVRLLIAESVRTEALSERFQDWERIARAPLLERIVAAQEAGALREGDPYVLGAVLSDLLDGLAKRLRHGMAPVSAEAAAAFFDARWRFFVQAASQT